jgi:hypothetical protein
MYKKSEWTKTIIKGAAISMATIYNNISMTERYALRISTHIEGTFPEGMPREQHKTCISNTPDARSKAQKCNNEPPISEHSRNHIRNKHAM